MGICESLFALPEDRRRLVAELVIHLSGEGVQSDVDAATGDGAEPESGSEIPSLDTTAPIEEDASGIPSAAEDAQHLQHTASEPSQ